MREFPSIWFGWLRQSIFLTNFIYPSFALCAQWEWHTFLNSSTAYRFWNFENWKIISVDKIRLKEQSTDLEEIIFVIGNSRLNLSKCETKLSHWEASKHKPKLHWIDCSNYATMVNIIIGDNINVMQPANNKSLKPNADRFKWCIIAWFAVCLYVCLRCVRVDYMLAICKPYCLNGWAAQSTCNH